MVRRIKGTGDVQAELPVVLPCYLQLLERIVGYLGIEAPSNRCVRLACRVIGNLEGHVLYLAVINGEGHFRTVEGRSLPAAVLNGVAFRGAAAACGEQQYRCHNEFLHGLSVPVGCLRQGSSPKAFVLMLRTRWTLPFHFRCMTYMS